MTSHRTSSKRKNIVTSALALFAEKGIRATTIRDIATQAGVTEGALYRHFESKDHLAASLFSECAGLLHDHLRDAVEGEADAHQRLCALVRGFFTFAETNPAAYEYVMARHHDTVGELPPGQPLPKDVITGVIEEGVQNGQLLPMDPNLGAAMIVGLSTRTIFFFDRGMIEGTREAVTLEVCGAVQRIFCLTDRRPTTADRNGHQTATRTGEPPCSKPNATS